jgi:hypothetical protein
MKRKAEASSWGLRVVGLLTRGLARYCIHHLLSKVPYEDMTPLPFELQSRPLAEDYICAPRNEQFFIPQVY